LAVQTQIDDLETLKEFDDKLPEEDWESLKPVAKGNLGLLYWLYI
jgi:hypothetical protein